jgi:C4-dicarboxylate-specific signal transduction histidine kinase
MISDLMLFARPPRLDRTQVDVSQIIHTVERELAPECRRRDVDLRVTSTQPLPRPLADAVQLAVAIKALCTNALEAIGRQGCIHVRAHAAPDDRAIRIDVSDDGPGVAPAVRPHVFDPFFSGREAGRGLGFGLSKCWRIVTEHGGRLEVHDNGGVGARFCIHLPVNHETP